MTTTAGSDLPSPAPGPGSRWAWAEVDLAAIADNVRALRRIAGSAELFAVVKANGYGHGATEVARAALDAGAQRLCVALVGEGIALRRGGIEAPILVLSQQPPQQFTEMVAHGLLPTVYDVASISAFADAVRLAGRSDYPVHLKVDTGMHRVGATPGEVAELVAFVAANRPTLRLEGVFTHLACADEPERGETDAQLDRFDDVLGALAAPPELVHAANSAATMAFPRSRHDAVRVGIAMYGIEPGAGVSPWCRELRPALSLRARVAFVKRVDAGAAVSYGGRWTADRSTRIATIPLGYADGVPRRLGSCGGEVLVAGRRRPIVGAITMDQLMVDCGPVGTDREAGADGGPIEVAVGDEVVLIGSQGDETIRAEEWAQLLGTIAYEIVCGISARIERRYVFGGASLASSE